MKTTLNYVIAECFIDTNLVQTLLCEKGINHQNSCSIDMKALQIILNYFVANGYGATQEGLLSLLSNN